MRLHPNPPRLVTVGVALALGIIGFILAWPLDAFAPLLAPVGEIVAPFGLALDRELGYLCLFACPTMLVVGSLLPGI